MEAVGAKEWIKQRASGLGVLEELRRLTSLPKEALLLVCGMLLREIFRFGKRHDQLLMSAPGGDSIAKLKSENYPLYLMCVAYQFYSQKKIEFLSKNNEEFQRRYWSDYRAYYKLKSREDYSNDYYRVFDEYFQRALSERKITTCLDVGCGGFTHILRLRAAYPGLRYVGIDFSKISAEVYNHSILGAYENVRFIPGSVCNGAEILKEVDLFYSFGVLMYMTAAELERFLGIVRDQQRSLVGIVVEPDNERPEPITYSVGHSFRHNYLEYFQRYGFSVLGYARRKHLFEPDLSMIFVYFTTKATAKGIAGD